MRRFAAAVAFVVVGLALATPAASAHALLASSQPAAGSTVAASPTQITLTFTERPDTSLSSVHVLDGSGRSVERGAAQPSPGQPETLTVAVPTLAAGVYTVTWRTTSVDDGHTTAGSFSFGVGVEPSSAPSSQQVTAPKSPSPTAAGVMGRWCLYLGLALLVGASAFGLATGSVWRRLPLCVAALTATFGLSVMVLDQRAVARVGLGALLRSHTGGHIRWEFAATALVIVAVAAWTALRSQMALAAVGAAAALAMLARADAGHAGGSSAPWFTVGTQWLHFVAVGAWAGGLPFLLAALARAEFEDRGRLARRFSAMATVGLAVVVATGVLRTLDELGAWSRFTGTSFGKTLLVKLCIVAVVVALGALNRFRNIRRATAAPDGDRALRRTVIVEIAAVTAVLGVTALLTGLAPAASEAKTNRSATPANVVAEGHDFGTTTRVRLTITPGTVGPNHFDAAVVDYDTGHPVDATAVALRFQYLDRADIPAATVSLKRAPSGRWIGDGTTIALDGRWRATAVIERSAAGLEVPVTFETRTPPQKVDTQRTPGLPTIYTVTINDGRQAQVYLDPGEPGLNELHVTYLDASGEELHILDFSVTADGPGVTSAQPLTQRKLDDLGHYVADLQARTGRYRFTLVATDHLNAAIRVTLSIEVP
ncbi:MAG TPA: copper resistance protein CopC [Acidimicrobiales bacterium]|nr:copper resistance protein CopC [Acidimicrobiales bacterium]